MTASFLTRGSRDERSPKLKQELGDIAGTDGVSALAGVIVRTQYCQKLAAWATRSAVGFEGDGADETERDFTVATDEVSEKFPSLDWIKLNAIVTDYRKEDLLDELIDTLARFSAET